MRRAVTARAAAAAVAASCALTAAGCSTAAQQPAASRPGVLDVVAAENFWGSIAAQIGGAHASVTSIITNPNADPHAYEPTAATARVIARAQVVVINGAGYDTWAGKLLAADAGRRQVVDAGRLLGLGAGANPHLWYDPAYVATVETALVESFSRLDPTDAGYFHRQRDRFDSVALRRYHQLLSEIRAKYRGTPVGASESVFAPLASALSLDLVTPASFLRAVSEGSDPSAADKATIDRQIRTHAIRIYVYNRQNTTPDVQAQLAGCRAAGIPTVAITETLAPAGATYQAWQAGQLARILAALEKAGPA
ncbi:MAG: metal ABC transporter solute-binding protein, Zn/Mn family [Acidimicrobiales bacterium]